MFEIYREEGEARDWRWRLVAKNGKVVADSGEGYGKRSSCIAAVDRARALAAIARVGEVIG